MVVLLHGFGHANSCVHPCLYVLLATVIADGILQILQRLEFFVLKPTETCSL